MNIISLFQSFLNHFNEILEENLSFHALEDKIFNSTNELNLNTLKDILEYIDISYKLSEERKQVYYVQCTRSRTLITSLGLITFNKTYYKSKNKIDGKYQFFSYLEDYLGLDKWAKMTLKAETNLINNSIDNGCSWASIHTIPNHIVSRQAISTKIKNINYNFNDIIKPSHTPSILYIEADEVHCNLQKEKKNIKGKKNNKFVPVILSHEGHKEHFVKKKELINKHYIASSTLKTHLLWNEVYKYLDLRYDLNKIDYLFVSGDGASWIKEYTECFPNAIYVYDKFHYRKLLNYIFKKDSFLTNLADDYLRNNMIDEFKLLVDMQIKLFPDQEKYFMKNSKTLINNIDGIINQNHPMYKCPCSMEGHISNVYARHMTSRPHAYSKNGLENTTQLITLKANNINLTEELYHGFKYGNSTYKLLNLQKYISSFRLQAMNL